MFPNTASKNSDQPDKILSHKVKAAKFVIGKSGISGFQDWKADLKQVLVQAGGKNVKSMFFVSETELRDDRFVQDLDMILSTGQVPDIFSSAELEDIFEVSCIFCFIRHALLCCILSILFLVSMVKDICKQRVYTF